MFSFDPAILILLNPQGLVSECTQKYLLIELFRAMFLQMKQKEYLVEDGGYNSKKKKPKQKQ